MEAEIIGPQIVEVRTTDGRGRKHRLVVVALPKGGLKASTVTGYVPKDLFKAMMSAASREFSKLKQQRNGARGRSAQSFSSNPH